VSNYLRLTKVGKDYPLPTGRRAVIVREFDLTIDRGEFVCLIGHSGCGKSTVLSMVAGLTPLSDGWMYLDNRAIEGPGPDRGVVFQSPSLLPWMTAFENVLLGVDQVHTHLYRKKRRELVAHYLVLVGLGDAMHKRPVELSAGMRQRVGIARAFALDPKMLLLDEPFGALDSLTRFELQQVLIDLWARNQKTALMVTHDVDEALFLSDRVVMMTNGPAARVGGILDVPFPRPRDRAAVLEHPDYYPLRKQLLSFLEAQDRLSAAEQGEAAFSPPEVVSVPEPHAAAPVAGALGRERAVSTCSSVEGVGSRNGTPRTAS
jgi:nitrate/nitrite transport system ATP-binding protein